ncbi:MAG: chalcone isomerase family protein [Arenicellales bacterium]
MISKLIKYVANVTLAAVMLFSASSSFAATFESQLSMDGQSLYLNGEGPRKKAFIKLYDTALYLTEKGSDAEAIVAADHAMMISIVVKSKLVTAKRITEAFVEGLEKSTGGNLLPIKAEMNSFLSVFEAGVAKGDHFDFLYAPNKGTAISKNGTAEKTIAGLNFKQALFGIWLSKDPIAKKLKAQLLGQ